MSTAHSTLLDYFFVALRVPRFPPPFKVQEGLLQLLLRTKLFALVTQSPARLTSPAMSHFSGYEPVLKQ